MIESITVANVASYGSTPQAMDRLSLFNFVFGSNATGKTTVSRVIADEINFPTCKVAWSGGTKLEAMVYNCDFVERNFNLSAELRGVFTLGEKQVETLNKIAVTKVELDTLTKKIETLTLGLEGEDGTGGKKGELAALEAALKLKCWTQKQKHDDALQGAFEGYRGNAEKFKSKVLHESTSNSATLVSLAELEQKAETVFGPTPTTEQTIPPIEATKLVAHENNPILKKRVIGKDDVDIAAMIKKLGNSDWVRQGREFYEENEKVCPFCQQSTTEAFAQSLAEYFDKTFVADSKAIDDLATNYSTDSARLQQEIASIILAPFKFLDFEKLKREKELLDSKVTINIQRLAGKKKEASQVVELESITNLVMEIEALIQSANAHIAVHNKMVANITQEQTTLRAQVWKFVCEELNADLVAYRTARAGLDKAITSITDQITAARAEKAAKDNEIRNLEKQTTSVQPTIDGINGLLASFGFRGFSLTKAAQGTSYKLVREDGSDAKTTLSEGEKNFVTFLYFYHLLKGSDSDSGMTTDRIVVFDDPVSSLDSDILFIVGSLIKELFNEVRANTGHIKQLFVLTHNVYFHKEVTFNAKRRDVAMADETFWVVRKVGLTSQLKQHPSNPIRTSYELLWSEIKRPDRSNLTIQNSLRRILENYFKILGGVDSDKMCALFEGKEKMICRSLFSWVNDGSHYAHDDLFISIDDAMVDTYLKVFKAIFEKADHFAHYKMMMGDAYMEDAATNAPN
jgi:wobble nucleotide-excising tRNase